MSEGDNIEVLSFGLMPRPPFRLDLAVWALRRRPENAIDQWDGTVYRRVIAGLSSTAMVEVRQHPNRATPRLFVQVHCSDPWPELRSQVTAALQRLLGIRLELRAFYNFASNKPRLGPLARRFVGMKPPRYLSGFECLVNAIACQQVSLASGIQLLNRFAQGFGSCFQTDQVRQHAFPRPEQFAGVELDDLRQLGFSRQKGAAVLNLASQIRDGEFNFTSLAKLSDEGAVERLCQLRGIGRWSAEYALLRGLGRLQVFPGDDVGARNNLRRWLGISADLDYESTARLLARWQDYGGLIYLHLLLDQLAQKGLVRAAR